MLPDEVAGRAEDLPAHSVRSASNLLPMLNPAIGSAVAVMLSQIN